MDLRKWIRQHILRQKHEKKEALEPESYIYVATGEKKEGVPVLRRSSARNHFPTQRRRESMLIRRKQHHHDIGKFMKGKGKGHHPSYRRSIKAKTQPGRFRDED